MDNADIDDDELLEPECPSCGAGEEFLIAVGTSTEPWFVCEVCTDTFEPGEEKSIDARFGRFMVSSAAEGRNRPDGGGKRKSRQTATGAASGSSPGVYRDHPVLGDMDIETDNPEDS